MCKLCHLIQFSCHCFVHKYEYFSHFIFHSRLFVLFTVHQRGAPTPKAKWVNVVVCSWILGLTVSNLKLFIGFSLGNQFWALLFVFYFFSYQNGLSNSKCVWHAHGCILQESPRLQMQLDRANSSLSDAEQRVAAAEAQWVERKNAIVWGGEMEEMEWK